MYNGDKAQQRGCNENISAKTLSQVLCPWSSLDSFATMQTKNMINLTPEVSILVLTLTLVMSRLQNPSSGAAALPMDPQRSLIYRK